MYILGMGLLSKAESQARHHRQHSTALHSAAQRRGHAAAQHSTCSISVMGNKVAMLVSTLKRPKAHTEQSLLQPHSCQDRHYYLNRCSCTAVKTDITD